MPFHRHDLLRLVLQRVEPVHVACKDLNGRDDRRHPHRHREHQPGMGIRPVFQKMPGAHAADHERGGEICRDHRVDEAIGKTGIEHDVPPAFTGQELPVGADFVTHGRLHPAVDGKDPERADEGSGCDHQRGREMQFPAHLVHAEQHDAQEPGFEEEGGQHLVCHQRTDDRSGNVGKDGPVRAELVGHDDARDDTHRKGDGEYLEPVLEQIEIDRLAGLEPESFQHRQVTCQPDGEGREDEMEAHCESELDAGQQKRVELIEHDPALPLQSLSSDCNVCGRYCMPRV